MHNSPGKPRGNDLTALRTDDLAFEVRMHLPDAGHARLDRIIDRRLKRHGRGSGHAVADRDIANVHAVDHLRITSIGHGEPAMIPVRSERSSVRSKQGCLSMAMNMVGTP